MRPNSSFSFPLISRYAVPCLSEHVFTMLSATSTPLLLSAALTLSALCIAVVVESSKEAVDNLDLGGLGRDKFLAGFVFGTATSAYQVEGMANKGGRGPSIWDAFIRNNPGVIAKNATAEVVVHQCHHYKEDVDLLVGLNFDACRFSFSWSRIFHKGTGKVNWKGVAYYNRLIDYLFQKVQGSVSLEQL